MFLDWLLKTEEAAVGYENRKMLAQDRSSWRQWRRKPAINPCAVSKIQQGTGHLYFRPSL